MASMWAALGVEALVLAGIAGVITTATRTTLRRPLQTQPAAEATAE